MQRKLLLKAAIGFWTFVMMPAAAVGIPVWTYTPLTATVHEVPDTGTATVQYTVQNQSNKVKQLVLRPTPGVQQTAPCNLNPKGQPGDTRVLTLLITGSTLPAAGITGGPILCQVNPNGSPNPNQCYQPSSAHILRITKGGASPPTIATINVTPTTLAFVEDSTGVINIMNPVTSSSAAFNVTALIPTGSGINIQKNTCGANIAIGASCTITLGSNTAEPPTLVTIKGNNTNAVTIPVTVTPLPPGTATIAVTGSPLTLTANGPVSQLTITNISSNGVSATNITSNFTGTALEGKVTETDNNCANLPPAPALGNSCTLTYTPGGTVVTQTDFTIQGTNTNPLTGAIAIQSGSTLTAINPTSGTVAGGTGFTLTGTGLTGVTGVTFGGLPATSLNVINSNTVTGVTPAHVAGVEDVVIDTPAGGATLANGYTYVATAIGQPSGGGVIACLGSGLNNFIAATADNSPSILWGGLGTTTTAISDTDGADNTNIIVATLGNNGGIPYAAQLCNNYEVDSQGHTPCRVGNVCYNNWFLPAITQLNCLYDNQNAIGGFTPTSFYWSSTQSALFPATHAEARAFNNASIYNVGKDGAPVTLRCIRLLT